MYRHIEEPYKRNARPAVSLLPGCAPLIVVATEQIDPLLFVSSQPTLDDLKFFILRHQSSGSHSPISRKHF